MKDVITGIIAVALFVILYCLLLVFPVMWIWNAVLPNLFGFKEITFWQSAGLIFLGQAIFPRPSSDSKKS